MFGNDLHHSMVHTHTATHASVHRHTSLVYKRNIHTLASTKNPLYRQLIRYSQTFIFTQSRAVIPSPASVRVCVFVCAFECWCAWWTTRRVCASRASRRVHRITHAHMQSYTQPHMVHVNIHRRRRCEDRRRSIRVFTCP